MGKAGLELVRVSSPLAMRVARVREVMRGQVATSSSDGLGQRRHDALLVGAVQVGV